MFINIIICAFNVFIYILFHKNLPMISILQMHWISVRFYEMGDITATYMRAKVVLCAVTSVNQLTRCTGFI